jgi:hypothetical protein
VTFFQLHLRIKLIRLLCLRMFRVWGGAARDFGDQLFKPQVFSGIQHRRIVQIEAQFMERTASNCISAVITRRPVLLPDR